MMTLETQSKILLLNTGKNKASAIRAALPDTEIKSIYLRNCIVHIASKNTVNIIYKNQIIPNNFTKLFIRRVGDHELLGGIIAEHFKTLGVSVTDPITLYFGNADSKLAQMSRLANHGFIVPESFIAHKESFAGNREYFKSRMSFPLVYKQTGSKGEQVYKIDSIEALEAKIESLNKTTLFMIQTLIPNSFDTRTIVAYGKVLGSIKRTAKAGNFHNNFSLGGSVEKFELTELEKDIAIRAAKVCKLDLAGVDFIHTDTEPIILELNKSPQTNGFEKIFGENVVFTEIAKLLV